MQIEKNIYFYKEIKPYRNINLRMFPLHFSPETFHFSIPILCSSGKDHAKNKQHIVCVAALLGNSGTSDIKWDKNLCRSLDRHIN